ncbi:Uncharacterised protein [Kingella potus]|uniref:DUF7832 domain-containing protein n=1 Tax=Kingella potus TaxID=265175 RepID=A0A377QY44_9NEIS|nr:hypothetical protein [Kingella potus]UOP01382.1 hypothetical protein LVJ84_03880 [Kingella potus]STR00304.1 Uncharacterised protein [Kingella potus]
MLYDHITLHTAVSPAQAARHIGYYYAWAVSQGLHSEAAAALPQFDDLQQRRISGGLFVRQQLSGGIDSNCFNDLGNRFTRYYYADEDEGYGHFLADYFLALGLENEDAFYQVPDTAEHQAKLDKVFQVAFERWKSSLQ